MIISSIKNRVRFSDENIKKEYIRNEIEKSLKSLDGIKDIRMTKEIGSLLINYDQEKLKLEQITDSLKDYIDVTEQAKDKTTNKSDYINKAANIVKKGMGSGKGKGGKGGKGMKNNDTNSGNLVGMAVDSFTGNGLVKTAVYGALGIQGYKKGKDIVQGKGKGKKNNK